MKGRLRVVKCTQRHRKIKETTEAQVKVAAETNSKKVDSDFPTCMRHEGDNNDDNKRTNEDLKGKKEEEDSNTTTSMEMCHCV